MIAHGLQLDHTLHAGWMAPYVEGIMLGKAVARCCDDCGAVSFPPLRVCRCGSDRGHWHTLTGQGRIDLRTTGQDGDFGLVTCAGADTATVMRLIDMPTGAREGRLIRPQDGLPALCLGPLEKEAAP